MRDPVDAGWRFAALALAWIAGVALHLQWRRLPPPELSLAIAVLGVAAGLWAWRAGPRLSALAVGVVAAALLGVGSSASRASLRIADTLAASLEGRDIQVTGTVASLPQRSEVGLRFRFEVDGASMAGAPIDLPSALSIGWYRGAHDDAALRQPQAVLRAGQRWRFTLRLRRPHGNLNPHGFDHELSLFEQGLRATGYVRDAPPPELLHRAAGHPVERLRQRVRDAIEASVPDRRAAGVLAALAVGDQGAIAWFVSKVSWSFKTRVS